MAVILSDSSCAILEYTSTVRIKRWTLSDKNKQYINPINKSISPNAFTYDIQHILNISPAQNFTVISIRYDKYILK